MKRNCRSQGQSTADEHTFATVLAYNFNTNQARTNIGIVFCKNIGVTGKFPLFLVKNQKT